MNHTKGNYVNYCSLQILHKANQSGGDPLGQTAFRH